MHLLPWLSWLSSCCNLRDMRDDQKREVEPNMPTPVQHESTPNRSTKAIARSTCFPSSNHRIPHQSQLPHRRPRFKRSCELNLGSLRSFRVLSLSLRFKLIVYSIQHESRRPGLYVTTALNARPQTPRFLSFYLMLTTYIAKFKMLIQANKLIYNNTTK